MGRETEKDSEEISMQRQSKGALTSKGGKTFRKLFSRTHGLILEEEIKDGKKLLSEKKEAAQEEK